MLNSHRQSVLANACVKPSVDPITRTPGTIYEHKGHVRLLGLLSESTPPQEEEYLDAGDGMLICMKRAKKRGSAQAKMGCWKPGSTEPNPGEASVTEADHEQNRQSVPPVPKPSKTSVTTCTTPEIARAPRSGSFPFHWMWESFSVGEQTVFHEPLRGKVKKERSTPVSTASIKEPPCTPETGVGPAEGQATSPTKDDRCSKGPKPSTSPGEEALLLGDRPKRRQPISLTPGSSLLPLYWKMEARSEARKRQLRQERHHWLQLTQQLLNLDSQFPGRRRRVSIKQLEEKLRAELLCLATEPEEPIPPRDKRKTKVAKEEWTFQPVVNRRPPNFKTLRRSFEEQLGQRKGQARFAICKPFHRHSASSSWMSTEGEETQDLGDSVYEVQRLWGLHLRAQSCPDFGPPLVPPVMPTRTSDKRQAANRLLLMEWERQERKEKQIAQLRRAKEQQVQKEVAKCLATYRSPKYSTFSIQRKLEELRKQEKQRMEEYTLQLKEMQDRVESRPYLFERVMQTNARQAVERRFSEVLSALGIDEEMLWKHAVRQGSGKSSAKAVHKRIAFQEDLPESV